MEDARTLGEWKWTKFVLLNRRVRLLSCSCKERKWLLRRLLLIAIVRSLDDLLAPAHRLGANWSFIARIFLVSLLTNALFALQDILENEDVKLDHMFIASLVSDIVKVCSVIHGPISLRATYYKRELFGTAYLYVSTFYYVYEYITHKRWCLKTLVKIICLFYPCRVCVISRAQTSSRTVIWSLLTA